MPRELSGFIEEGAAREAAQQCAYTGTSLFFQALRASRWRDDAATVAAMGALKAGVLSENRDLFSRHTRGGGVLFFDPATVPEPFAGWMAASGLPSLQSAPLADRIVAWLSAQGAAAVFPLDETLHGVLARFAAGGRDAAFFLSFFQSGGIPGLGIGCLLSAPPPGALLGREMDLARHLPLLQRSLQARERYLLSGKPGCGKTTFLLHLVAAAQGAGRHRAGDEPTRFLLLTPADFRGSREEAAAALQRLAAYGDAHRELVTVWDDFERFVRHPFLHELLLERFWTRFRGGDFPVLICGHFDELSQSPLVELQRPQELKPLDAESSAVVVAAALAGQRAEEEVEDGCARFADHLVTLGREHYHDKALPDAALRLLEGSLRAAEARTAGNRSVTVADVQSFVSGDLGLSPEVFGKDKRLFYRGLYERLGGEIFGQGHVLRAVCEQLFRRALSPHSDLPRGRFLFIGTPGTGKTQLARMLARHLGYGEHAFYPFNMSEYANDGARTRFIGSDPGYVGYGNTFTVFTAVTKSPACIILLDEIDRAHSSIQDVLLSMLEGSARDGAGHLHRFAQAVFIMTTNLGQETIGPRFQERFPDGSADDEERAAFGEALAAGELRSILRERKDLSASAAALQEALQRRAAAVEGRVGEWLAELEAAEHEADMERASAAALGLEPTLETWQQMRQALDSPATLSGRNPLDRAFLDRIDFLFPFLPLEERHIRAMVDHVIVQERVPDIPPPVREALVAAALAERPEVGRAVARHWAAYRGRTLANELWQD